MLKPTAVNNVIILKKDKSYIKTEPITSEFNYKSQNMTEIPEPYTGIIDSIGVEDSNYQIGQHVLFEEMGGVYIEFETDEYVVIPPEMIIGILN